jgi:hypothetical protein
MMILTPAYGRDYKSKKALLADFDAGKDFVTNPYNGPSQYVNKVQIEKGTQIQFRYNKLQSIAVVTLK